MKEFANIEDFYTDDKVFHLDPEVEKEINEHMRKFEIERRKREAEAIEASKHIYINR